MILHKIYQQVYEVQFDLQQLSTDQQKKKFLESVKEDKINKYKSDPRAFELIPKLPNFPSELSYTYLEAFLAEDDVIKFCDEQLEFLDQKAQLEQEQGQQPNQQRSQKANESSKIKYKTLFEAFINSEKYQTIMNYLVNKNFCNSGNYHWKDTKEILIGTLKQLHIQGYLHRKLTHKEMITICKNTFGVEVSKRICNTKPENELLPDIPLASTLS